jgi:hypothetical protein
MVHFLNKFALQFDQLLGLLESGFERLVTANIRTALARRVEQELRRAALYRTHHSSSGGAASGGGGRRVGGEGAGENSSRRNGNRE